MTDQLTDRQRAILAFIREHMRVRGFVPSVRELMIGFGIKSTNGIMCHLHALERKGYLKRVAGQARALVLVKELEEGKKDEQAWQRLRLTLLWYFGSTDPEEIHEWFVARDGTEDKPVMSFEEMLKKAAECAGSATIDSPPSKS